MNKGLDSTCVIWFFLTFQKIHNVGGLFNWNSFSLKSSPALRHIFEFVVQQKEVQMINFVFNAENKKNREEKVCSPTSLNWFRISVEEGYKYHNIVIQKAFGQQILLAI